MNQSTTDCSPRHSAIKTLDNQFLVVLTNSAESPVHRGTLEELGARVRMYKSLPLIEVECGADLARTIANLPGVAFVLPALEGLDQTRPVVIGIDFLASFGEMQRRGDADGGRTSGQPPGYPVLRNDGEHLVVDTDADIDWPAEPAIMPVINMSLGTKAIDYPFLPNDAVNVATYGVASTGNQLVVISAGNCGQSDLETLSAWAQPPWVLSVGATADEDGKTLAPYSARGTRGDPESGPDVVAWGRSQVPPHPEGTSFAAPRVSLYALICAAALLELRHGLQVAMKRTVEGVRLVGFGFIDSFGTHIWQDTHPRVCIPALPIVGTNMDEITNLVRFIADHGIDINVRGKASTLRSLLMGAAKPIPNYERHETGAGFLNEPIVLDHLAGLSGTEVLNMFATHPVPAELAGQASGWSVFDRRQLSTLADVVRACAPQWRYDYRRQRFGARPCFGQDLSSLSEDEREYGTPVNWPPAYI